MKSLINDRTKLPNADGDRFIVTGSIGPQFAPRTFGTHGEAMQYAREIEKYGRKNEIHPPFKPVIEHRWKN
jgi:hypothetical protein